MKLLKKQLNYPTKLQNLKGGEADNNDPGNAKKGPSKIVSPMDKVNLLKLMTAETATVAITPKTVVDPSNPNVEPKKFNFFNGVNGA